MAWPNPPLLDDFDRADESPLSDGGNWITPPSGNDLDLVSDAAQATFQTGPNYGMWVESRFAGAASASVALVGWSTMSGVASGTFYCEIMSDDTHSNCYAIEIGLGYEPLHVPPRTVVDHIYLRRRGSWVFPCDLSSFPDPDLVIVNGDAIGVAMNDGILEAWFQQQATTTWTFIDSADDFVLSGGAAVLPAGWALIGANHPDIHFSDLRLDDFHAGGTMIDNAAINNVFGLGT